MQGNRPRKVCTALNRQKIAILTDSCCDIPPELAAQQDIFILPLKIIYPEGEYSDGVDITAQQIYQRMPQQVPTTSLPDAETVLQTLERIRQQGFQRVIGVCLSAGLSGAFNMVRLMAQEYPHLETAIFDSNSGSLGEGCVALELSNRIQQGMEWPQLLQLVPQLIQDTFVLFSLDTLEYLKKGGRIGKITWLAGSMLQIKPILSFAEDGQLTSVGKIRGRYRSIEEMAQRIREKVPLDGRPYTLATAHGGCPGDLAYLKELLHEEIACAQHYYESAIDCTLSVHTGPHLIGAGIQLL